MNSEELLIAAGQAANLLKQDNAVKTVLLKGSLCLGEADRWSDIDLTVVVHDEGFARYSESVDWLMPMGSPFAMERYDNGASVTLRVCLMDFRRFDIELFRLSSLGGSEYQMLTGSGYRVLFCRPVNPPVKPVPQNRDPAKGESFDEFAYRFWFKAVASLCKLGRGDFLVAGHLALGMAQDTVVLQMMLRDRYKGTAVHRFGDKEPVAALSWLAGLSGSDGEKILRLLYQNGAAFDRLAKELDSGYQERFVLFHSWAQAMLDSAPDLD